MYLTGATLFLSLGVSRVFYVLLDFIHTQEELTALQGKTAKGSSAAGESDELRKRVKELEAELKASNAQGRDFGARSAIHSQQTPSRSSRRNRPQSTTASRTSTSRL